MSFINPKSFTVDYLKSELTVDGKLYLLGDAIRCAAASEILTNYGSTNEVQMFDDAGGIRVSATLDQLVNLTASNARDPLTVAWASRTLSLTSGNSIVTIVSGVNKAVRVALTKDSLAGFLTLVMYLRRYLLNGITIVSPDLTGLTDTSDVTLSTVVDGKIFKVMVENGLVTMVSC